VKDIRTILDILDREYPDAQCSLNFSNPLELLVATILSAQCTDERVNKLTRDLFKKYRSAADYASAPLKQLEVDIKPTGFFRNKAKSLKNCCAVLEENFGGQVPADMEKLVKLPGIGRKTANVILGTAYNIPGIVVDTHVGRIVQRLGLTEQRDPVKIEFDLMKLIPQEKWTHFSHQLIQHGRKICTSRKPKCRECPLLQHCDHGKMNAPPQ